MKTKRVFQTAAATVLSMSALLTISISAVHAAPGSDDCLWTGATSADMSVASNWDSTSCSNGAPVTGDTITIDNSNTMTSGTTLDYDLTGVVLNGITFQGNGSDAIVLQSSTPIELNGNITDNTTESTTNDQIDAPITLQSNSTITATTDDLTLGDVNNSYTLTNSAFAVAFTGNGDIYNDEALSGSGDFIIDMTSGTVDDIGQVQVASPNFTGPVQVQAGELELSSQTTPFTDILSSSSGIDVSNGADVYVNGDSSASGTLAEPLSLSGDGTNNCTVNNSSANTDCGAIFSNLNSLTLSGSITLYANTELQTTDNANSITITGQLAGAYTVTNPTGILVVDSSANTSSTPNGTYTQSSSSTVSNPTSAAAKVKAPGTPDTGFGLTSSSAAMPLVACAAAAAGLYIISRKFNRTLAPAKARTRKR